MDSKEENKHEYKRGEKGKDRGGLGLRPRTGILQPAPMEGLASQARPTRTRISIDATIKLSTYAQGHAFQAHSLQIILLGPFACEPNVNLGLLNKSCPYNWRRLWEGLRVGSGGGGVKPLSSKGL